MHSAELDRRTMEFIEAHTAPGSRPDFERLAQIGKQRGLCPKDKSANAWAGTLWNTWRRVNRFRRLGKYQTKP